MQILSTTFTQFTQEQFFMRRGEVILVVCMEFFHLKCKAIMKRKPAEGVAGRIKQRLGTLIMTQRVNYFYNVHLHSINSIATTKSFPIFTFNSNCFQSSFLFLTSVKMLPVKLHKQNRADCSSALSLSMSVKKETADIHDSADMNLCYPKFISPAGLM